MIGSFYIESTVNVNDLQQWILSLLPLEAKFFIMSHTLRRSPARVRLCRSSFSITTILKHIKDMVIVNIKFLYRQRVLRILL